MRRDLVQLPCPGVIQVKSRCSIEVLVQMIGVGEVGSIETVVGRLKCGGSGGALRRVARCAAAACDSTSGRRHSPCWALAPLRSAERGGGGKGGEGLRI